MVPKVNRIYSAKEVTIIHIQVQLPKRKRKVRGG